MEPERGEGKPTVDRKGAEDMAPTREATYKIVRKRKTKSAASWRGIAIGKKGDLQTVVPAGETALPHGGKDEFEDRLIQKCLDDGMSESEIQGWMQEI